MMYLESFVSTVEASRLNKDTRIQTNTEELKGSGYGLTIYEYKLNTEDGL